MPLTQLYSYVYTIFFSSILALAAFFLIVRYAPQRIRDGLTRVLDVLNRPVVMWTITVLVSIAVFLYFAIARVLLYKTFQLPVFDFGIYVQTLWKVAHNQSPSILFTRQPHWLGDHFQPILYLIAPFARILQPHLVLLILEPLAVAGSCIFLAALSYKYTKSTLFTLALVLCYSLGYSSYFALFYPFHPSTLVGPLLLWALWALDEERWYQFGIAILLALGCKEDVGYYLGMLGVWMLLFRNKKAKYAALPTILVCFGWSILATKVFIPHFKQQPFDTIYTLDPQLTSIHQSLLDTVVRQPSVLWKVVTNSAIKNEGITASLVSFGLLPLLYLIFLPIIPVFAERFYSSNPNHYSLFFHYGAPAMAVLAFMALRGGSAALRRLTASKRHFPANSAALFRQLGYILFAVTMLYGMVKADTALGVQRFKFRTAYAAIQSPDTLARQHAVDLIPADASVIAQDGFATNLAARNNVMILDGTPLTTFQYVLLDPYMPSWPLNAEAVQSYIDSLSTSTQWKLIYHQQSVYVFQNLAVAKS